MNSKTNPKIIWLLILQGWAMLLVVLGHAPLSIDIMDPNYSGNHKHIATIYQLIYSFHMPLFMMISGYLFYLTRIEKPMPFKIMIYGKLKRLAIPFLVFTLIAIILKTLFKEYVIRKTTFSLSEFFNALIYPGNNPLGELWFISTLLILFTLSPIFVFFLKKLVYSISGLLFLIILFYVFPSGIEFLGLSNVVQYSLFFFTGLIIGRYKIIQIFDRSWLALFISGTSFIVSFYFFKDIRLITTFLGCAFSFSLAKVLNSILPNLFSSFRNYTYQIFLLGIFFQMGFKILYNQIITHYYYNLCFIVCALLGIYCPVIISLALKKINCSTLNIIVGLPSANT